MSENQEHNRVTIFSNGIADFSRVYQTTGAQQALELPVNKDHIGDILASLIISGPVKLTVPPCFTPANEQTGKLTLSPDNVFQDIFTKLRGAEVEIAPSSGETLKGRIWGLDSEEAASGGQKTNRYFGQVLTEGGLQRILQETVKAITFPQESVQSEVDKALDRAFQTIRPQSTTVRLEVTSEKEGKDFFLHYTVPAAAWKMTYRLRTTGDGVLFDGVGVVDNNTEEDWNDFMIGLVVGEPITFSTDIATSKTPQRSNINLVSDQAQGAVEVEHGYRALRAKQSAFGGAAPAEMMMETADSMLMEDGELEALGAGGVTVGYMDTAPAMEADAGHREVGDFSIFEFNSPLTIKAGQSAEIPVFNTELGDAETVLFYKATDHSERPFRAIKFKNGIDQHLGRGVCTVYEAGTYAGSAIFNATKKGEEVLLCHALETGVRVHFTPGNPEQEVVAIQISEGAGFQTIEWTRHSEFTIKNIKDEEFKLILDHEKVWDNNGKLTCLLDDGPTEPTESLKNGARFEIAVPADGEVTLFVDEQFTQEQRLHINSNWITSSIIAAEHPLANDPAIQKIMELQQTVDTRREEEKELENRLQVVTSEQQRIRGLIKSDPNNEEWKADLRTTETEIREISREEQPAAQKAKTEAQRTRNEALKKVACQWKRQSETAEK